MCFSRSSQTFFSTYISLSTSISLSPLISPLSLSLYLSPSPALVSPSLSPSISLSPLVSPLSLYTLYQSTSTLHVPPNISSFSLPSLSPPLSPFSHIYIFSSPLNVSFSCWSRVLQIEENCKNRERERGKTFYVVLIADHYERTRTRKNSLKKALERRKLIILRAYVLETGGRIFLLLLEQKLTQKYESTKD